jgi:hypothetical protein
MVVPLIYFKESVKGRTIVRVIFRHKRKVTNHTRLYISLCEMQVVRKIAYVLSSSMSTLSNILISQSIFSRVTASQKACRDALGGEAPPRRDAPWSSRYLVSHQQGRTSPLRIWNGRRGAVVFAAAEAHGGYSSANDAAGSIRAAHTSTCRESTCANPTITGAERSATASAPDGSI